jgi:hypothetical protein
MKYFSFSPRNPLLLKAVPPCYTSILHNFRMSYHNGVGGDIEVVHLTVVRERFALFSGMKS